MSEENPYASPPVNAPVDPLEEFRIRLDGPDHVKAEAIIKDAGQFWVAIILCVLCSLIGPIIVPIWYTVRLVQWNRLSNKYPDLMVAHVSRGTFQAKFQSAQWKLITGLVFGYLMLGLLTLYFVGAIFFVSLPME